jgi:hypothetical protein
LRWRNKPHLPGMSPARRCSQGPGAPAAVRCPVLRAPVLRLGAHRPPCAAAPPSGCRCRPPRSLVHVRLLSTDQRLDVRPLRLLQGGSEQPRRLGAQQCLTGARPAVAARGEKGLWNSYPPKVAAA